MYILDTGGTSEGLKHEDYIGTLTGIYVVFVQNGTLVRRKVHARTPQPRSVYLYCCHESYRIPQHNTYNNSSARRGDWWARVVRCAGGEGLHTDALE